MAKREFIEHLEGIETILKGEGVGFLGLVDGPGVYVVPLNYAYVPGRIIVHCSRTGHKLDCIRAHPDVCFTVGRQTGEVQAHGGGTCHVDNDSVICYGRARIVEDLQEKAELLNHFQRFFRPDAPDLTVGLVKSCTAVEIRIMEMTGRHERQGKTFLWRHRFSPEAKE